VKHSRASRAAVSIDILPEEVRFAVIDDGVGMPLASDRIPLIVGHFGLQQVQERLDMVGGELVLDNLWPSGFRVAGGFPITR
jgi:signal transduction histidine kinase